jgi:hypothetical protein
LQQEVVDQIEIQLRDNTKARILDETQSNPYVSGSDGGHRTQDETYKYYQRKYADALRKPAPPEEKIPLTPDVSSDIPIEQPDAL